MKEKRLRIGDKIKWNVPIGGGLIYTIMNIDTSRPYIRVDRYPYENQILFQWEDSSGTIHQEWSHSYEDLNRNLNKGGITIVERNMVPYKELLKFSL